jgi:ubiquinone/menaquinone biosynthesis C-methylase UbiE
VPEESSFYDYLGKIGSFNSTYIGGTSGRDRLLEKLGIQRTPKFMVLEVGAATGYTSCHVAQEYGCSVTSTDISEILVEKGRRRAEGLGLENVEFRVADAMGLDFQDGSFDAVYGIAITGVLPDKLRALSEYARVVKKEGVIGGLELFIRDEAPPDLEETINTTMGKVVGTGTRVMRLDEWRGLLEESGLDEVELDPHYEGVFESPGVGLGTVSTYLKLVYYLIADPSFRSLFFEIMALRKQVSEASGDIFDNMGYLIFTGRKR